jgi:hypothetical protein
VDWFLSEAYLRHVQREGQRVRVRDPGRLLLLPLLLHRLLPLPLLRGAALLRTQTAELRKSCQVCGTRIGYLGDDEQGVGSELFSNIMLGMLTRVCGLISLSLVDSIGDMRHLIRTGLKVRKMWPRILSRRQIVSSRASDGLLHKT